MSGVAFFAFRTGSKRRRRLVWLLGMIVVGGAMVFLLKKDSDEPSFEGRRLSEWLEDLGFDSDSTNALAAVHAMGTNAVPYLIRHLSWKPNRSRYFLFYGANKVRATLHLRKKPFNDPRELRYSGAYRAFKGLGPTASNSVPALAAMLDQPYRGRGAAFALMNIGSPAIPVLAQALTNDSPRVRLYALEAVCFLDTNAPWALPGVWRCLGDTNVVEGRSVGYPALGMFCCLCRDATLLVPALTKLLNDPDGNVRSMSLINLGELGAQSSAAVPAITGLLTDPDPVVRLRATNALRAIAPDRFPGLP
jgi:hypothetical protein